MGILMHLASRITDHCFWSRGTSVSNHEIDTVTVDIGIRMDSISANMGQIIIRSCAVSLYPPVFIFFSYISHLRDWNYRHPGRCGYRGGGSLKIGRESDRGELFLRYGGNAVFSQQDLPFYWWKTDAEAIAVVISNVPVKLLSAYHGYRNGGMGVDQGF